jgi:hypothetical protein
LRLFSNLSSASSEAGTVIVPAEDVPELGRVHHVVQGVERKDICGVPEASLSCFSLQIMAASAAVMMRGVPSWSTTW